MESIGKFSIVNLLHDSKAGTSRYLVEDPLAANDPHFILSYFRIDSHSKTDKELFLSQLKAIQGLAKQHEFFSQILEIYSDEEAIWWIEPNMESTPLRDNIQMDWSEKSLHRLILALVEALESFYSITGCPHGNISSASIELIKSDSGTFTPLIGHYQPYACKGDNTGYLNDLHALGKIIISLVTNDNCEGHELQIPLYPHPRWESLGPKGRFWKQLASWLVYPDLNLEQINVAKLKKDLSTKKSVPVIPALSWAAAIAIIAFVFPPFAEKYFFGVNASDLSSPTDEQLALTFNDGRTLPAVNTNFVFQEPEPTNVEPNVPVPLPTKKTGLKYQFETSEIDPVSDTNSVPSSPAIIAESTDRAEVLVPESEMFLEPEITNAIEDVNLDLDKDIYVSIHSLDTEKSSVNEINAESSKPEKLIPEPVKPENITNEVNQVSNVSTNATKAAEEIVKSVSPIIIASSKDAGSENNDGLAPLDLFKIKSIEDKNIWESSTGEEFVFVADLPGIRIPVDKWSFTAPAYVANSSAGTGSQLRVTVAPHEARSLGMLESNRRAKRRPQSVKPTYKRWENGGFVARTEISQRLFEIVMGDNPSLKAGKELPVNSMTWKEAMQFCERWTMIEHNRGTLPQDWVFTIPTGDQFKYLTSVSDSSGSDLLKKKSRELDKMDVLSMTNRRENPHQIEYGFPMTSYKLYALFGNLSEWCFDDQDHKGMTAGWSYDFTGNPKKNPFMDSPDRDRSSKRIGFRCVLLKKPTP